MFESYLQPFIIMLSIPLGLIGVSLSLWVFKKPISLGVWIGLMILAGIVVNSAIVMVEKMNIYKHEKGGNILKNVLYTPKTYFSEIIMTVITSLLGILPLIFNPDETATMWRTLGITIFFGLLVSTILILIIVPLAYLSIEKFSLKIKSFSYRVYPEHITVP